MAYSTDTSRRLFLRNAALATGGAAVAATGEARAVETAPVAQPRPNILMICSDQFRTDFVGANGLNPSTKTPNIDALAARGTNFQSAVCNQPLCSPSRASFLTGRYATETKVWKLGLELDHTLPTIATTMKGAGYETAFIGKWHVSGNADGVNPPKGWIAPGPSRGGFDDLWEGANVLEVVSHPNEGSYWNNTGEDIGFKDVYRVDFLTGRAVSFLEKKHDKPWLLFLSQLEPHHQNDVDNFIGPKRYEGHYDNAFVPQDLRDLPGNWNSRLPGYYGCVQAIDDCVGKVVETLKKTGQLDNTVIVFFSDHGCHFRTRMGEYKRSPHDASIRVPLIFAGPGFDCATACDEVVSLVDLAPTLLAATGTAIPSGMRGKSLKSLADTPQARQAWDNTAYIQISGSMVGRALRTRDWTYAAYDPKLNPNQVERSMEYIDYALYHNGADPYQKLNLIGRPDYAEVATALRAELIRRIAANGEPAPKILKQTYYV